MFARMGSVEPLLVLLAFVAFALVAAWYHRRRRLHPHVREPEDLTASLAEKFVIKPYVQLGNYPRQGKTEQFEVLFHARFDADHDWAVQARVKGESNWLPAVSAAARRLKIAAIGETVRCTATLSGLPAGVEVEYRVLCDGDIAFAASCYTRNNKTQPFRFAVAGDLGEPASGHEQKIAYQIHASSPNFVVVPGDIVYERGRVSEYMCNFFPVYNADQALPARGAPVLRSVLMMGAAGNHDMGMPHAATKRNFTRHPDLLGYYLFFSQPLNGPIGTAGSANTPLLDGNKDNQKTFMAAAGDRYPRMASFSFEWGNSFWLVLDANAYMDWTDEDLRRWVDNELAAAKNSRWKFVTFHQPGFTSDLKHSNEHRMRLLAPIFQKHGVDVVFVGHVHCYERTHPLRFTPHKLTTKLHTEECPVEGDFEIDRTYDGKVNTRPNGILYVTSGAGGAKISPESDPQGSLKPYTAKYDQSVHSFTSCQLTETRLVLRQISEDGEEIDHFVIDK